MDEQQNIEFITTHSIVCGSIETLSVFAASAFVPPKTPMQYSRRSERIRSVSALRRIRRAHQAAERG